MTVRLYDYWRSSACYRVRIALNLKGIEYETIDTSLIDNAHQAEAYRAMNPQGFVPMLEIDGCRLTQSLAIVDYLDAKVADPPFAPKDPAARAHVLGMALVVACDIHPLNNLRVLAYLKRKFDVPEPERDAWYRHWVIEGLAALESLAADAGAFLSGETPGIADLCLVPQLYNARRFGVDVTPYPTLTRIDAACAALEPFARAHPDAVKAA